MGSIEPEYQVTEVYTLRHLFGCTVSWTPLRVRVFLMYNTASCDAHVPIFRQEETWKLSRVFFNSTNVTASLCYPPVAVVDGDKLHSAEYHRIRAMDEKVLGCRVHGI